MSNLVPFTKKDQNRYLHSFKGGFLRPYLKKAYNILNRLRGNYPYEDCFKLSCYSDLDTFFLKNGVIISHPFGITLSAEEMGADCMIGQNCTIGTNSADMSIGGPTEGFKPKLGHMVRCYASSIISGPVRISNFVIVAGQAFVSKNVPEFSIVYGVNQIKPMKSNHIKYLQMTLYHSLNVYNLIPGLVWKSGKMYIDLDYIALREHLMETLERKKNELIRKEKQ